MIDGESQAVLVVIVLWVLAVAAAAAVDEEGSENTIPMNNFLIPRQTHSGRLRMFDMSTIPVRNSSKTGQDSKTWWISSLGIRRLNERSRFFNVVQSLYDNIGAALAASGGGGDKSDEGCAGSRAH